MAINLYLYISKTTGLYSSVFPEKQNGWTIPSALTYYDFKKEMKESIFVKEDGREKSFKFYQEPLNSTSL